MRACFDCSNSPARPPPSLLLLLLLLLLPDRPSSGFARDLSAVQLPEWPAILQGVGGALCTAAAPHHTGQSARVSKDLVSARNRTEAPSFRLDFFLSLSPVRLPASVISSAANPIFAFFSLSLSFQSTVDAIFLGVFCQKKYLHISWHRLTAPREAVIPSVACVKCV